MMNALNSNDTPVAPDREHADLLKQLRSTREAVYRIRDLINEMPCTTWVKGRAEGAALEATDRAADALMVLDSVLTIRLRWRESKPEVPPVTDVEDEAFQAADWAVAAAAACGFCHGEPVKDAAGWVDGQPRPPAPCPRCGETHSEPMTQPTSECF
jgi:cytochrome c553